MGAYPVPVFGQVFGISKIQPLYSRSLLPVGAVEHESKLLPSAVVAAGETLQCAEIAKNWKKLTMWYTEGAVKYRGVWGLKKNALHTEKGVCRSTKKGCVRARVWSVCVQSPEGLRKQWAMIVTEWLFSNEKGEWRSGH